MDTRDTVVRQETAMSTQEEMADMAETASREAEMEMRMVVAASETVVTATEMENTM